MSRAARPAYPIIKHLRLGTADAEMLAALADTWRCSESAALRRAIQEAASREALAVRPTPAAASLANSGAAEPAPGALTLDGFRVPTPEERAAQERLRELTERIRAGEHVPPEEMGREIEILRRHAVIVPPQQSGPPSPEWRAEFRQLLEEVRAGVPAEWSEEELRERVEEAVASVRQERRARDHCY